MAFVFHIHASPSCEATHHAACASVDGSAGSIAVCRLPRDVTEGSAGVSTETRKGSVMKKNLHL